MGLRVKTHRDQNFFAFTRPGYEALLHGAAILLLMRLVLLWMYRRKIFLRI